MRHSDDHMMQLVDTIWQPKERMNKGHLVEQTVDSLYVHDIPTIISDFTLEISRVVPNPFS